MVTDGKQPTLAVYMTVTGILDILYGSQAVAHYCAAYTQVKRESFKSVSCELAIIFGPRKKYNIHHICIIIRNLFCEYFELW